MANHILLHPGTAPTPRGVIKGRSQGDSFSATALLWVLRAGCPISPSLTSGGHGETHPILPGLREGIENEKQRDDDDSPCIKPSVQLGTTQCSHSLVTAEETGWRLGRRQSFAQGLLE